MADEEGVTATGNEEMGCIGGGTSTTGSSPSSPLAVAAPVFPVAAALSPPSDPSPPWDAGWPSLLPMTAELPDDCAVDWESCKMKHKK